MRIGLAQINTTVGDLPGNEARILSAYEKLVSDDSNTKPFFMRASKRLLQGLKNS